MHFPDLEVCCDWFPFFSLKTAGVRGAGTRDEPLRTSVWEATLYPSWINVRVFTFFGGKFWYKVNWKVAVCYYVTVWFSFFSYPGCATLLKSRIINREVVFLYIDDPNDRFLKPAVIHKRNVAMNIYERSQMAITWLSYVVILCKLYLHNILPSLLSDFLRVRVRVRVIVGLIFVNPTIVLTETIYCFCFFFFKVFKVWCAHFLVHIVETYYLSTMRTKMCVANPLNLETWIDVYVFFFF